MELTPTSIHRKFCSKSCSNLGKFNCNYKSKAGGFKKGNIPVTKGKTKKDYPTLGRPAGFISEKRKKKTNKYCETCNTEFWVLPCFISQKYCCRSCINKGRKKSIETIQKELKSRLNKRKMTEKEKNFMEILNVLGLDYSFVGDGKLIIDRYCPDFCHNKKKKIIELCSYKKEKIEKKNKKYGEFGYETLFVFNNSKNRFQTRTIKKIKEFSLN